MTDFAQETPDALEFFLACAPGLEPFLQDEALAMGFLANATPGGVTCRGTWADVWRANLALRGASKVLVRIGGFRAMHLAQLDKRSKKFDWSLFPADVPVSVEVICRKSRIYHAGAAAQRIEGGLQAAGLTIGAGGMVLHARIEDDFCSFSVNSSGELLHKRGHKVAVNKAPMRETLAALFLRACGYDGTVPLLDPMCGSGTFPLEAGEMSMGLMPGRSRAFAFEGLTTFDPAAFDGMKAGAATRPCAPLFGYDRDQGAIRMATKNAERAGVPAAFQCQPISELQAPDTGPGLVIVNPPYGARIGNKKLLYGLYGSLGARLKEGFAGWRVGLVTSDKGLAKATGLKFADVSPPIPHGGLKVHLFQSQL